MGWRLTAALLLLTPLIQGGAPRLPRLGAEMAILALAGVWCWSWARAPRRELRLAAPDALLGGLLFLGLFSTLFAPYYHAAESVLLFLICCGVLYWHLVFHPSFAGLALALAAVRVQAGLQALLVLAAAAGGTARPAGTFFNPNLLAGFLAAALLLAVAPAVFPPPGGGGRLRVAAALAEGALLLAALLATGSRGGVLALVAGLSLLLALRSRVLLLAGLLVASTVLLAVPNPLVERLRTLSQVDDFAFTRLAIWKSAWAMALSRPFLGVGLGQFEFVEPRFAFPVPTHWAKYSRVAEHAHSEYLQAAAETGLPGLALVLAAGALLVAAARKRLRAVAAPGREAIAALLAATAAVAAHAAVDLPLRAPPGALLLVLLAAGLRLHGVVGGERAVAFRVRPLYAAVGLAAAVGLGAAAVRPVVGFWYFLGAQGAPRDLLNEKWALAQAPRAAPSETETLRLLRRAARIDFVNAPYRRALGSKLFQASLNGGGGPEQLRRALYELHYAIELNPNQYQYRVNLGEALVTLARRGGSDRQQLGEALAQYRQAARLAPFDVGIQERIGVLAEEVGDLRGAEDALRRAVSLEEYYLAGWLNLGAFYARRGRIADAEAALRRGAGFAETGKTLVATTPFERELLAVDPSVFYNELKRIGSLGQSGGAKS